MKRNLLLLVALMALPIALFAQSDDDMYFVPSKKKTTTVKKAEMNNPASPRTNRTVTTVNSVRVDTAADYHIGNLRDVDDYNRRGGAVTEIHVGNDTIYVRTDSSAVDQYTTIEQEPVYEDNYYDDDYYYTSRMLRFRGIHAYDPFLWDISYGWYDPWYDPWYGWYGSYYRLGWYSWYDWGWGWHHHPGWDLGWGHGGFNRPVRHDGGAVFNGGRRSGAANVGFASRGGSRGARLGDGYTQRSNRMSIGNRVNASTSRSTRQGQYVDSRASTNSRSSRNSFTESSTRGARSTASRSNSSATTSRNNSTSSSSRSYTPTVSSSSRSSSSSSGSFGGGGGSFGGGGGASRGGGGGGGRGGR